MLLIALIIGFNTNLLAQKNKQNSKQSNQQSKTIKNNDWQGLYSGITNCANCKGLQTNLKLSKGNKYVLSIKAINVENEPVIYKGSFRWDGDIIHLQGIEFGPIATMYKVEKDRVKQLYLIDNKIQGENWTDYTLYKQMIINTESNPKKQ